MVVIYGIDPVDDSGEGLLASPRTAEKPEAYFIMRDHTGLGLCQACARAQDGRKRRTVAAAAPFSWIAACQLPPKGEIVELRAYLRQRERLLEYAASHIQHMQKALTEMNLQLHLVVADIAGATGLRIIRAILAGERDPAVLAKPAPAHGLFRPDPGRAIERRDHPTRRHDQDRQRPGPTRAGRRPLLRVYSPNGICAQLLMPCRRCRVSL